MIFDTCFILKPLINPLYYGNIAKLPNIVIFRCLVD